MGSESSRGEGQADRSTGTITPTVWSMRVVCRVSDLLKCAERKHRGGENPELKPKR